MADRGDGASLDADVAIVGYGPVGAVLAILLAQLGRHVVVLERWPEPYPLPRAVHFDHEVGRILQACGLGGSLADISEPADVYEWRNGAGTPLLRFGRTGVGSCGWPASSMFNQPALEALLDERARSLGGVELRRGVVVDALEHHGDHVSVGGVDAGGAPVRVTASYVVGCDGANSSVRSLLDLPVTDLGFFYDWLIVDVVLREPRVFDPINLQICDPARPTTVVSGGPGRRRWEFMRLPGESLEDLNDRARAWKLLADWDVSPANADLERHAVYTFQARWADRWRRDRALIAGDAAHQMPPFAGQGMCSGIRDAANLAWKLDLVLDGRAHQDLLDTYQAERQPNVAAVVHLSMELGGVICVPDPDEAAARDAAMSAAVVPGEVSALPDLPGIATGLVLDGSPGAGTLFPQGNLEVDGTQVRLDDHVGAGWRLVAAGSDPLVPHALAPWFASIGGVAVALDAASDVDGVHRAWFDAHGVTAALVRPDFHVYASAAGPEDLEVALQALRAQLAGGRP